jgi:hypothetical protein
VWLLLLLSLSLSLLLLLWLFFAPDVVAVRVLLLVVDATRSGG